MMRPMKLGGEYMVFGKGALDYLSTLKGRKAFIVMSGPILKQTGALDAVVGRLAQAGISSECFDEVEPEPSTQTMLKGAELMKACEPDWIIGLGGGSAMDAAKGMWVFYEHPELKTLQDITPPNKIPPLRQKAKMISIPTTSGTASEVSRSIVISDKSVNVKQGIGDMEMMPDIALLEPELTASMPSAVTAQTGIDALTHAVEAYVSNRANDLTDILAEKSALEIFKYLPLAYKDGGNMLYREKMQTYAMIAGLAFTNCSLGIVHSIAHSFGAVFNVPHGLANGVVLPYVIRYNYQKDYAKDKYDHLASCLGETNLAEAVRKLKLETGLPAKMQDVIKDDGAFMTGMELVSQKSIADGCTKTNPIIPDFVTMQSIVKNVYYGD